MQQTVLREVMKCALVTVLSIRNNSGAYQFQNKAFAHIYLIKGRKNAQWRSHDHKPSVFQNKEIICLPGTSINLL